MTTEDEDLDYQDIEIEEEDEDDEKFCIYDIVSGPIINSKSHMAEMIVRGVDGNGLMKEVEMLFRDYNFALSLKRRFQKDITPVSTEELSTMWDKFKERVLH